jgi:sugar phosphate isomerase/epimerase
MPGKGALQYDVFLEAVHKQLPADTPLMLEHLSSDEAYREAATFVRSVAESRGIPL